MSLKEKIRDKSAKIAVLGLGHVGHPLACLFGNGGFDVVGFDLNTSKIKLLKEGAKLFQDFDTPATFYPTSSEEDLKNANIFLIVVPTPLKESDIPDLSYVENASKTVVKNLKRGDLVILVSTTYPGTTEEIVQPILEKSGLKAGKDFYLCYCPERVDPGNTKWKVGSIPQVVSGINENSLELAVELYSNIINSKEKIVRVSSLKVAEATKLFENVFRNINIALVNETAKIFEKLGIDTWEVIKAASTKPYAFLAHYPGLGVGGHCIPLDPFYLYYKARTEGLDARFIQLAGEINRGMPYHVLNLAKDSLKNLGKDFKNSEVAVLGLAYKKNIDDSRETPSKTLIQELLIKGAVVTVYDPYVTENFGAQMATSLENAVENKDCIILAVDHDKFKDEKIEELISRTSPNSCVVDTKNFLDSNLLKVARYTCLGKS